MNDAHKTTVQNETKPLRKYIATYVYTDKLALRLFKWKNFGRIL